MGFWHKLGLPHVNSFSLSFSLSLPLFFRLIPWNTEALCIHFSARASKTPVRGSPRQGTLRYSSRCLWPTWTGQVSCLETLLAFRVNQGIAASFLLYFFTTLFFPNLSLITDAVPASNSLDPPGLDPGRKLWRAFNKIIWSGLNVQQMTLTALWWIAWRGSKVEEERWTSTVISQLQNDGNLD